MFLIELNLTLYLLILKYSLRKTKHKMLDTYNQFIKKFPNWVRWLLVPIAAALSYFVITFVMGLLLIGSEQDDLYRLIIIWVGQPFGAAFISTLCVYHTAPHGKFYMAIVVGSLFIAAGGWGIFFYGTIEFHFWMLVSSISSMLGAGGAIFTAKNSPIL